MKLSIVIPIYNEEAILEKEVGSIINGLFELSQGVPNYEYELLLVENGSDDRTREIVDELAKKSLNPGVIRAIHLPNAGYGPALKKGLLEATGEFVVLFNIDFWDVQFIHKAMGLMNTSGLDMVVGSKTMKGAEDTRPFIRRTITRGFNKLLKAAFGFSGTDTHGMKLLRREKMIPVIEACSTEREIFDTEFVLRAQAAGFKTEEIPVVCQEKRKTTYRISKRIPRTAKDLLILFFTLRLKRLTCQPLFWLLLLSLGFFFWSATLGFPDSPAPWFDEGINLGIAKTFVQDHVYSLRLAPGQFVDQRALMISSNYPVLLPIIIVFQFFGIGLAQSAVVMIIFLTAFLFLGAITIRQNAGFKSAVWSVALVATFLPFYGHGLGGGLGEVPGLVYLFLGLLFLDHKRPAGQTVLAGIFFGLCAATKVFYLTVLAALAASELWYALGQKRIPWKRWLLLATGILPPLIIWLFTVLPLSPSDGSLISAWRYYSNPYHVTGTILANLRRFATESTPIHFVFLAIPFFFAFAIRINKRQVTRQSVVLAVFVILNIIWWLRTPGWYRYLFPAHLVVLLFFPVSLFSLFDTVRERFEAHRQRLIAGAVSTIIFALVFTQAIYLISNRSTWLYVNSAARYFARELETNYLPADADLLVLNKPEMWFLLTRPSTAQYVQMNPYEGFGNEVFYGKFPQYILTGEPIKDPYLRDHIDAYNKYYTKRYVYKAYVVSELRRGEQK